MYLFVDPILSSLLQSAAISAASKSHLTVQLCMHSWNRTITCSLWVVWLWPDPCTDSPDPLPLHPQYIDPLPPIDHSELKYEAFVKNFYIEPEDIAGLSVLEIEQLRSKLGIKVGRATRDDAGGIGGEGEVLCHALENDIMSSVMTGPGERWCVNRKLVDIFVWFSWHLLFITTYSF